MKHVLPLLAAVLFSQAAFAQNDEVINPNTGIYWRLRGNTSTNDPAAPATYGTSTINAPTEHFVGTTDANDLVLGTNQIERMRVKQSTGYVGIGTAAPLTKLDVVSVNGWDVVNTAGDFTISGTYPFRIGVAQGGAGAGDVYMLSRQGTQRIFMGGGTNNQILQISGSLNSVGVRTTGALTPATALDVNGDFAMREGTALALANGANGTIAPGTYSHVRLTGPTAAFSIAGLTGGVNGKIITLINTTAFDLTLLHNSAATVANGFYNPSGTSLVLSGQYNTVTLIYNSTLSRWVVQSTTDKVDANDWHITGNTGINDPATPVTYGTSTIAGTENWMGTTDANDVVWGTNNIERMRLKQSTGNVGIGTAAPAVKLDIVAPGGTLGLRVLSGNAAQLAYLSVGRDAEYAQIGAATAGTFFTDAATGDMAVKNFNSGKILFGASFVAASAMAIIPGGNVGINTSTPSSKLDINGDLALREGTAIAVVTGSNALTLTGEFSHYRLTGAAGAFAVNTIAGGNNGQVVTLINAATQTMTINNNNAANGILTGNGANLVSNGTGNSSVTLMYNATLARWVVTSSAGMLSADDWHLTGNAGTNDPAAPTTYGTTAIGATENWIGTTDANDLVFGTNNLERMRIRQTTGSVGIGTAIPGDELTVTNIGTTNRRIRVGAYTTLNQTESGRITFDEGAVTYTGTANYCGLEFRHDGALNRLFLEGGCTAPINIMTYERSGNVGVGTATPTLARFQVQGMQGNTSGMFGGSANSQGISLVTDWPGIYFNCYYNGGTLAMANSGFPSIINSDQGSGGITFNTTDVANTTQNAAVTTYERMRVTGAGLVGIGLNPGFKLDIYDANTGVFNLYRGRNGNATGTRTQIGSIEYFQDESSTIDFTGGSYFSINLNAAASYYLQVAANSAAKPTSNTWTVASDARLKEDVNPFKDGLKTLKQINPVYFKYTGKAGLPQDYGIGVLAQDIQKVAPYTVGTWEYLAPNTPIDENTQSKVEEYLSLDNGALTYVTINAVKELDAKVEAIQHTTSTISDFGTAEMTASEMHIDYSSEFSSKLTGKPVVTITSINSGAPLYLIQQDEKGFTVKYNGAGKPSSFNWIAMAKVNSQSADSKNEYTEEERNRMLAKVKLPAAKIRIQRELDELAKRKVQQQQAEQQEKAAVEVERAKGAASKPTNQPLIDQKPDDQK